MRTTIYARPARRTPRLFKEPRPGSSPWRSEHQRRRPEAAVTTDLLASGSLDGVETPSVVTDAKHGDRTAFAGNYSENFEQVRRVLRKRLRQHEHRDLDDLVQEVFTRAWRCMATFEWQGKQISAWLTVIACNLIRDYHKRASNRLEALSAEPLSPQHPNHERSPLGTFLLLDARQRILVALRELTPAQKNCIVYRFYLGFTVNETAEAMGIKNTAVKALQHRAIKALATLIPTEISSAGS